MKDLKKIIAKKDKLLSDCVEFKRTGWFRGYYQLNLTQDFKNISPLEGDRLEQALITYHQHPATVHNPHPAWILEVSCDIGFIVAASFLRFCRNLASGSVPLGLFYSLICFFSTQKNTQKNLDFIVHWYRGERAWTSWKNKYSQLNITFVLLEQVSQWQKSELAINIPPLYFLTEAVKKRIESRIPAEELKAVKEIKHFEEKVNTLVVKAHNSRTRQSWCEWFSIVIFRNQRPQHVVDQADPVPIRNPENPGIVN